MWEKHTGVKQALTQRDKLGGHCKQQSQLQVIVDCPKREALETERRALFQIHFDWGGGSPQVI